MKSVVINKSVFQMSSFYIILGINGLALFKVIQDDISIWGSIAIIGFINIVAYLLKFLSFHEFNYNDSKLIVTNAIYPVHDEFFFKEMDAIKLESGNRIGYKITIYSDNYMKSYAFKEIDINDIQNMINEINLSIQKIKENKKQKE